MRGHPNRSREFDHLWDEEMDLAGNLINLFNQSIPYSIPYSINLFTKRIPDLEKAKSIVNHLKNGYPHEGEVVDFKDNPVALFEYFLMVNKVASFEDNSGEIAKKIHYVLGRLWTPGNLGYPPEDAFFRIIAELAVYKNGEEMDAVQRQMF